MAGLQIFLLLLFTLVPGYIVFWGKKSLSGVIKPLLSLSGTFLLALSFCHLLPESYAALDTSAGYYVLGGFFIQIFLENLTKGVEHGHYHHHGQFSKLFPLLAIAGLTLHSIVESLPMMHQHHHDNHNYLVGILMHKTPIAITLATILSQSPISKLFRWLCFGIFCISSPLTIFVGSFFPTLTLSNDLNAKFSAIAVGIFLHVATTILFELEDGHRLNPKKLIAILLGLIIYFIYQ